MEKSRGKTVIRPQDIEVGTSGWKFDDWAGVFYPFRVPQSRWLEYYASRFSIGEINSTYYRIAGRATYAAMVRKTPDHFRFFCKVHADVTHTPGDPTDSMNHLMSAVAPIREAGKLRGLLAQFPNSFVHSEGNLKRIMRIAELANPIPMCVEFRHSSWESKDVWSALVDEGIVWVTPDEPVLPTLPTNLPRATESLVYFRLHGRNAKTWFNARAGDRYDYDYSNDEMSEIGHRLLRFEGAAERAVVLFNNCYHGQAVSNAIWFRQWLEMMESDLAPRPA